MEQRLSLVTLAVRDLARSRAFYCAGLGWQPLYDLDDVVMIQVGPRTVFSLWRHDAFAAEVGEPALSGIPPVTLAHNVGTDAEVDAVLADAAAAGADVVQAGTRRDWGGYSGYFADPDGYRWEIAHAGGDLDALLVPGHVAG